MSSDEPQIKRQKKNHNFKKTYREKFQNSQEHVLQVGLRGFLATCNFQEQKCIRECYNILNHYADELYGVKESSKDEINKSTVEENDITDDLEKEIENSKLSKKNSEYRFQVVNTGANNCLFIKTTLPDPIELGLSIVKDIADTKKQRSRHLYRLVPISTVVKANLKDIIDSAGKLFDLYFLKESKTFSVIFNKRLNNNVKKDEIIKELAELVVAKNIKNKVDLKNAEVSIIVEVIKGLCCLSVVPNYLKYKKYNLIELATQNETYINPTISSKEPLEQINLINKVQAQDELNIKTEC